MELLARTCKTEQMNTQRLLARLFVLAGGLLWVFMAWGAEWTYRGAPLAQAAANAAAYAVAIAVIFIVGMFYEYIASLILATGAAGIVIFGLVVGWEAGVWAIAGLFFVIPMLVAAALYALAARMQRLCTP